VREEVAGPCRGGGCTGVEAAPRRGGGRVALRKPGRRGGSWGAKEEVGPPL
jgi:hypothetical protein